ncbi:MAG: histidine phosphatase family protein [Acidimicrobiia bacterium]|nr:histidine phosphatase family protein [Acidimicrobiia bacterium]
MVNLMFMRHGKSDWDVASPDDHSRPLNTRGKRSAERMGVVIRELGLIPELVVSSTALRARSTAELARISGGWDSRLVLEDDLYGASVFETLAVAAHHGGSARRIMLVGHQPTWGMVVTHLTGSRAAIRTATVVDIEMHATSWDDVPQSRGALVSLLQARTFLHKE